MIDDTLALKVGAISRERDGFYHNVTLDDSAGDIDFASYTAALRWAPNDSFDAILTYDRIRDRGQIPPQDPRFNGDDPFENLADKKEPVRYDVDQVGLRAEWELGNGYVVNSITGYHSGDDKVNQDFDGAAIDGAAIPFAQLHTLRDQKYDVFTPRKCGCPAISRTPWTSWRASTTSIRNSSSSRNTNNVLQLPPVALGLPPGVPCGVLTPILGLRANPGLGDVLCQFPNARSIQRAGEDVQSVAVFGAINWRPVKDLELSFGARYIDEEKDAFNSYFDYSTGTFDTGPVSQEHNFAGAAGAGWKRLRRQRLLG